MPASLRLTAYVADGNFRRKQLFFQFFGLGDGAFNQSLIRVFVHRQVMSYQLKGTKEKGVRGGGEKGGVGEEGEGE